MLMLLKPACLALTLTLTTAGQSEVAESPFPPSSAIAEGVSPDELSKLSDLIQSFVDDEEIVGGELLVIKNGNSILHQAYGWNDREEDKAMEIDTLFCVRSMTKPFIGVSILMLIDDDLLEYDDPVSKYLPAFDVEGTSEITIEQLLTHTSGLPMSLLLGKDLKQMHEAGGIQAVAELGAGHELQFEPGTDFNYSDQGTDTLTAVIEVVTGGSAASFVETRILEPLGMSETLCVLEKDHPLLARGCSKYVGSRGQWSRYWSPEEERLFPFFLGSQGMYSTLTDYARFLNFWKRKGRASKKRLLGLRYARKAMTSSGYQVGGTGFPGLLGEYGCLLQLWTGPGEAKKEGEEAEREVVVLGHTGSDGTHAWLFPEQDAMVLYFTQSRNGQTAMQVEEQLGSLLLGVPFDPNQAAPPFEDYMGYYWEGEGDLYRSIVRDGEDLALEVVGRGIVPLSYLGEDRWKLRPNPSVVLAFDRSEDGVVIG
ncbi:MAG: CubicO group peptidase (beta-lactamase class C family), partial [Planctomycetota bacterium]